MNNHEYIGLKDVAERLWDEYIALSYHKQPYGFKEFLRKYHPNIREQLDEMEGED